MNKEPTQDCLRALSLSLPTLSHNAVPVGLRQLTAHCWNSPSYGPTVTQALTLAVLPLARCTPQPSLWLVAGLRGGVVSACFLKRPLLSGPFPFCQRQFFFFWIPGWGQATLRHFLPRVYIWLQQKEREIGKGSRAKRCWWGSK